MLPEQAIRRERPDQMPHEGRSAAPRRVEIADARDGITKIQSCEHTTEQELEWSTGRSEFRYRCAKLDEFYVELHTPEAADANRPSFVQVGKRDDGCEGNCPRH